jgi:HEPN domain-containing protein
MSEADPHAQAGRWLRYAAEDLAAAEAALGEAAFAPRHTCWLAQQAAEKAIKAALVFLQVDFPWVHDLDVLRNLLPEEWRAGRDHPDLAELSEWAVEARYPPSNAPDPSADDARAAVEQSRAVNASVCSDLRDRGVHLPPAADRAPG